ncbi:hypothetical protein BKA70DRAFT_1286083 [Coprinopsis sp. MPI-PUGE-AT-0042]|nr:hypothetical protein BKA70DRAFT_1286083 [Coprinopsis sp. MPI-PUGE-AT-0042]
MSCVLFEVEVSTPVLFPFPCPANLLFRRRCAQKAAAQSNPSPGCRGAANTMLYMLSTTEPWNAIYRTPDGQAAYRAETPYKLLKARRTFIDKFEVVDDGYYVEEVVTKLAEIEYHTFKSSKITIGDKTKRTDDIFHKKRWGWYGRDRVFEGPDGREYRWELGTIPRLYLNDERRTIVAKYHQEYFRMMKNASLEIFSHGEHMADVIVVTFIYIEYLRAAREENSEGF